MLNIVKTTTFPSLLDVIAPHYCRGCGHIGKPICDRCEKNILRSNHNLCPLCKQKIKSGICSHCKNNKSISLPPSFIIGERSGLLNDIIHDYKYNSVRAYAKPLAKMLDYRLPKIDGTVNIVPLPTINSHIRSRGLDHTLLIAKKLAHLHPSYKVTKLLLRNANTIQVGSNHDQRIAQAANAYRINPKININKNATYILLDDVWTTGASLQSAVKILKANGVEKIILAILSLSILN